MHKLANTLNLFRGNSKFKQSLSTSKKQWLIIINIIIIIVMGILHSVEAGHYANFIPINGTFQDYNPIRRFLSGQIPYKDFQDYLGLGHLYLGAIFTGIFGGKYRASLIAFRLVAYLSTALIFFVILKIVLKKTNISLAITDLLLAILLIKPTFFEALVGDKNIENALDYAMSTGNSARMLRGAILPISIFLVLAFGKKLADFIRARNYKVGIEVTISLLAGCLAGACFPWSNDYGVSSWLCIILMVFFIVLSRERKILKALLCLVLAFLTSLIACFIVVEVLTIGHFYDWFSATFGTGGYQTWYYISSKSFYITDVDFSYIECIQALIGLFYLWRVWEKHGSGISVLRYGLLGFCNLTCFCAVNEYKLLSGAYGREVALVVLFVTILAEVVNYIGSTNFKEKDSTVANAIACIVCIAWIISAVQTEFNFHVFTEKEGVYVEALGGYMTSLGEDILETAEFLGNKRTFATYASGQELVSGNFQPSGTDYLIHVLGDKQREAYLRSFKTDEFDYAVTINETYSGWEFWLQRANWFFYESLFANWHPIYANSYEIYWERNNTSDDTVYDGDISVCTEIMDSKTIKIIVETDESVNGTADVYIDYESNKSRGKTKFLVFNTMVDEVNTGVILCDDAAYEHTYLRSSSQEYIPVTVVDGHGEVTLTAKPEKAMTLTVNDVQCSQIFTVQYQYLYIDEIISKGKENALHVVEGSRADRILQNIKYIYIDGYKLEISKISDGYIFIEKSDNIEISEYLLKKQNVFKVE